MKRKGIILTAVFVLWHLCCGILLASPTTAYQAEKVVKGWLKTAANPLGTPLGQQVKEVKTFTNNSKQPIYYIVYLQPNGFVIVPADDLIEPIIGFVQEGTYDPSPANPLGALVTGDLNGRIESVRTGKPARTKAIVGISAEDPQDKWSKFIGLAEASTQEIGTLGLSSIDDVRVSPLVQTRWSQTTICSGTLACYNYYTPPVGEGRTGNYPCGCVATALAQIMRYHEYPNTGIGKNPFTVKVSNYDHNEILYTRGGDGNGVDYNWGDMVLVPGCGTTLTQQKAIGALCYDAGVGISNLVSGEYTQYYSNETLAYTHSAKVGLKSTFKYGNAIFGFNSGSNIGAGLIGMVNPNLDAGLPVYFGIRKGTSGHAVVCDGYGYNAGTMYHHLNMGWAGTSDAWYDLPDITSAYNTIYETIYNICPTLQGNREMISGRVTNPSGNPISGVMVYADYPAGYFTYTTNTNANGIYAFDCLNSNATFYVGAMKTGYIFGDDQQVQTGHSSDSQPTSGNVWGIDIVCVPPDVNTITPTSGPWGTYMKIQGIHFGSSPGTVVFPGGYSGEILQWSDTLILCRNPCPYSGDVIVRTAVGVNSVGVHFEATNPTTIYVDVNHTPDVENGSISYPFSTIERGIYVTTYTDTVIVKPGIYNENINLTGDWGITLTSTDPNDPNIVASTVIDGGGNGAVVTFNNDCSVLTGFTITNGYTDGSGGGIYCNGQCEDTAPTISHCLITRNSAGVGGGISCYNSSPMISHCTIADNWAYNWCGGGIYCYNEQVWYTPTISHCLIIGNSAEGGGGICSIGGNTTVSHCDISSNNAGGGGGILCAAGNMMVHHTILWADTAPYGQEIAIVSLENSPPPPPVLTIEYSDVQGGLMGVFQTSGSLNWDANSIIDADPMFVSDPNPGPDGYWDDVNDDFGDLHLHEDSPCIEAGDPCYVPGLNETDMDGQPRVVGCRVDIGTDEFVYLGDIELDGDVDFADFAAFADYWQETNCGKCGVADLNGDGIVDIYDLAELAENWLMSLCKD